MELNKNQKKIISELEKNILLVASAGTGKTNTLSKRIENIIKARKAKPCEILCITFTNKAAKEMEIRIRKTLDNTEGVVDVKTFHSFCFDLIKMKAKKETDVFTDFIIFDENDTLEVIKRFNDGLFSPNIIQKFINMVKEESLKNNLSYKKSIEYIFKNAEDNINGICTVNRQLDFNIKNFLMKEGIELINKYNNILSIYRALDFNDLILKAKEILKDKNTINYLMKKYKYINIDEVQDTSTCEYEIIEKIFGNNNVLICGDIFQTIYEWRGSEPLKIINNFIKKYKPIKITLNENYRATKRLSDAAKEYAINAFSKNMREIYKEDIISNSNNLGEKITIKENENLYEEARFIYTEIQNLKENNKDITNTCILTRSNQFNIDLSRELSYMDKGGQDFEFILVDQFKFFRRTEVKDILAFFKLLGNKHDSNSLKRILKRFKFNIEENIINIIESTELQEVGIELSDFIDNKALIGEYFSILINEYKNDNIVIFDVESTGINIVEDEIIQIAAIKINSKGDIIKTFERFLVPTRSVSESFYIHGFSDEFLLEKGEDKAIVLKDFIEFLKDSVVVGHNVRFDIDILTSELIRNNIKKDFSNDYYDTLDIYRRFYKNLENYKLETLSKVFKTKVTPNHNAMDDILATKELLVRAIENDILPTTFTREVYFKEYSLLFLNLSEVLNKLIEYGNNNKPHDILTYIIKNFNVKEFYSEESLERFRDLYVLLKNLYDDETSYRDSILDVLRIISLSNGELESIIIKRSNKTRIPIITVHQAKGLEFDNVFLSGVQDGKFPSYKSIKSGNLEEEKRTFYVAITRAKKRLYISFNKDGGYQRLAKKSRFIDLIPSKYINTN